MLTTKKSRQHLICKKHFPSKFSPLYKGRIMNSLLGYFPIISLLNNAAFTLVAVLYSR